MTIAFKVTGVEKVERSMADFRRAAADYRPFFTTRLSPMVSAHVQRGFETQGASLGTPWAPKVQPGRLLYRTGKLLRAATVPGAAGSKQTLRRASFSRTVNLPQAVQQYGKNRFVNGKKALPARPFFVITPGFQTDVLDALKVYLEDAASGTRTS